MDFTPKNPSSISIKPLNKGMYTDVDARDIPMGGGRVVGNLWPIQSGLRLRPGITWEGTESLSTHETIDSERYWKSFFTYWETDGDRTNMLVSGKYLYKYSGTSFTGVYLAYSTGTVSITAGGTTVTLATGDFTAGDAQAGDYIIVDTGGSPVQYIIASVTDTTHLEVTVAAAATDTSVNYSIRKAFKPREGHETNHCMARGDSGASWAILTDGNRAPFYYDGTSLAALGMTGGILTNACVCAYFGSRLWLANTYESTTYYKNRIRWSSATDIKTFDAVDYIDLVGIQGEIIRIVENGTVLIVYCTDSIWYGRQTNYPDLPYVFIRLDTGGVGLPSSRAVIDAPQGHFIVGQNGFYFLTPSLEFQSIPCPMQDALFIPGTNSTYGIGQYAGINCVYSTSLGAIVMSLPTSSETVNSSGHLVVFVLATGGWSIWDSFDTCTALGEMVDYSTQYTWTTLNAAAYTWTTLGTTYTTWSALNPPVAVTSLFIGGLDYRGYVGRFSPEIVPDRFPTGLSGSCYVKFWSADYDFDKPDDDKTVTKLNLRLRDEVTTTANWVFEVNVSEHRGANQEATLRDVGDLTFSQYYKEQKVDFRATGSRFAFQLVANWTSAQALLLNPFSMTEIGLRVKLRSKEERYE